MSDTLVAREALDAPSNNGQAQQASGTEQQGTAAGQTSDNGQSAKEQENIKRLQSIYDKRVAEQQAQIQQSNQQVQQLMRQLEQMQDQTAPDDFTRLENQLRRAEAKAQQYEAALAQQQQERQAATARETAINTVAAKYGVDPSDLSKANDYDELVEQAILAKQRKANKQKQEQDDRAARNAPDVGGGRTNSPSDRWQEEWNKARDSKDSVTQQRLLRELKGK